ncbi:MAG TPA: 30S ribosomal protein S8 [Nitrospinaceae bacterium]|jgi:small subunit ribosomal protein S8|nr:30S ribosomal protein S8 [Nitrospinota bacterium]MDP6336285.1 30S ribosomal protein S8 [Nitrospinaceae bacterium]HAX45453.1 30S ribosomal protein S8 [Nitrospina sp.]MDP7148323.1 30S ribosomal protein S8 [Nitrospinaceae bacterium]MDP7610941.1 30S ribosomal protein S8 [Nitrospinaceae bacterium]|tara:strand:+ start:310 stop:702 length:393 start_codon:yes stop_codon:yes gene_type:complete
MMTDPIADLFTRIRNGLMVKHDAVIMPNSKMKTRIAEILKDEGFIKNFRVREDDKQGLLKVYLKYHNGDAAIRGIKRISKPGRRTYVPARGVPKVLNGLGIAIITTSSGVMTDELCREKGVGGEVLGYIW